MMTKDYGVAKLVLGFTELIAWIFLLIGIVTAFGGGSTGMRYSGSSFGMSGALPGIVIMFLSILSIASIQGQKAAIHSAETGQEMLQIAIEQLRMAKAEHGGPMEAFKERRGLAASLADSDSTKMEKENQQKAQQSEFDPPVMDADSSVGMGQRKAQDAHADVEVPVPSILESMRRGMAGPGAGRRLPSNTVPAASSSQPAALTDGRGEQVAVNAVADTAPKAEAVPETVRAVEAAPGPSARELRAAEYRSRSPCGLPPEHVKHKGQTIEILGADVFVGDERFDDIDAAKAHIDRRLHVA